METKPQTLKEFYDEHRVAIIIGVIIAFLGIVYFSMNGLCSISATDMQKYNERDLEWNDIQIELFICPNYMGCNCEDIKRKFKIRNQNLFNGVIR